MSKLRPNSLFLGRDGRNRCLLSPYRSNTGRNQPSNSRFIFGQSRWYRGLIKPPEGYGLANIDFASQEIAIAAALSGDERMMDGYATGDPYLAFAKDARLAPPDATKATHKAERDRCKQVVLGVNYGMGHHSLAAKLGITPAEASIPLSASSGVLFTCGSQILASGPAHAVADQETSKLRSPGLRSALRQFHDFSARLGRAAIHGPEELPGPR